MRDDLLVARSNAARTQLLSDIKTPAYVYDLDAIGDRFAQLQTASHPCFGIRYAIKSNPHADVLTALHKAGALFDASSIGEVRRALDIGVPAKHISFTGPAKRRAELEETVALNDVTLVIENLAEAEAASEIAQAAGQTQRILVRIGPARSPKGFGARMTGRASQFGIDEEDAPEALDHIQTLPNLNLAGLHIYAGSNALNPGAIVENFHIMAEIFETLTQRFKTPVEELIFGSGFGIPYHTGDQALSLDDVLPQITERITKLRQNPHLVGVACQLELGRWLVGPAGVLVLGCVGAKTSRGEDIRMLDAGFNAHLAAAGMMGSLLRRSWPLENLTNPDGAATSVTLVGPLCTSIDVLATKVELPEVRVGDKIAVGLSGAYGLTASPTGFISHPIPDEVVIQAGRVEIRNQTQVFC